ncbi:hypothetical protein OH799_01365 [Nocardia sp. NBC_00881]|uniref:hypothetical protein n=1 Tax=Nocardia sp. NBC_00881 TaxID=2975995 RepID=UPI003866244F|nr:hypothetical protein OH799_01365 [Nocardia sp. NBC_00881]
MGTDLDRYTAPITPAPRDRSPRSRTTRVLIAGVHAAFATPPRPGTVVATFDDFDMHARPDELPIVALVRVEYATQVVTANRDGSRRIRWERDVFGRLPTGIGWRLSPAATDPTGRIVIGQGWWAAGGREIILPAAVRAQVPGVPAAVALHDHDPHTGWRPW